MDLPGTRLLAIARLWFDERSVRDVFEPLVADWQAEFASAPASAQRRIWLRGVIAFAATTVSVAGRSVRREILVPPPVGLTGALIGAALASCGGFALLANVSGGPPPAPTNFVVLAIVVWASLIWPPTPNRPSRERPLATYLKLSTILLLVVGFLNGSRAIVQIAPLVPVWAGMKLPIRRPRDELRRMALVFTPFAVIAVMSPVLEPQFWPDYWVGALYVCWAMLSVLACSLDATRTTSDEPRTTLESGRP